MSDLDGNVEISLESDTFISKLGQLTTSHSPRVISHHICVFRTYLIHYTLKHQFFFKLAAINKGFFNNKNYKSWSIRPSFSWLQKYR